MKIETAIDIFEDNFTVIDTHGHYSEEEECEAVSMAIKALKQIEPRMVVYESDGYADGNPVFDIAYCPNCDYAFEQGVVPWGSPFCPNCGQALAWKRLEEDRE